MWIGSRIARMYSLRALAICLPALVSGSIACAAAERPVAVLEFEPIDSSLEGGMNGLRSDEQERILRISSELRRRLAESDDFPVVDIGPVTTQARAFHLQECGGCDVDLAAVSARSSRSPARCRRCRT